MKPDLSSHMPAEVLEQRAAEQRERIDHSITELKSSVRDSIHERLDVESYARSHLWPVAGAASLLALLMGYGITGMFTRR